MTKLFVKAYTCYRLTTVAVILISRELSLLNVFFQTNYREMNGLAGIVESTSMHGSWIFFRGCPGPTARKLDRFFLCFSQSST